MGQGACLYCSLRCWVFNKLVKLTSLGLWPLLLDHTADEGDCLLDSTRPAPWGLAKGRGCFMGTEEAQRKENWEPSLEGLTAHWGRGKMQQRP